LIKANETGVTFRYKDYRIKGPGRYMTMTLAPAEFIRRFMLHVLPKGFHRIRPVASNFNGLVSHKKTMSMIFVHARGVLSSVWERS
jgi:hypothetical protein